jgi:anionic cell wall polymer biosynthesis LytR-Cps2A-Psr (LCP) family protein
MSSNGEQQPSGAPEYKVYRSRKGLLSRLRSADLTSLRERAKGGLKLPRRGGREGGPPAEHSTRRLVLKWIGIVAGGWILLSIIAFLISAQLQSTKLDDRADAVLSGSPFLLTSPQTILVIGTDARVTSTKEPGAAPSEKCFEQQSRGEAPHGPCSAGQFRADTLLLVRAGGGAFRKLSIPRDTFAEIPGQGPQKINAAYTFGGAALQIKAVKNFLGIDIDHVVIIDFKGFEDFINAIGGVKVDVPH